MKVLLPIPGRAIHILKTVRNRNQTKAKRHKASRRRLERVKHTVTLCSITVVASSTYTNERKSISDRNPGPILVGERGSEVACPIKLQRVF